MVKREKYYRTVNIRLLLIFFLLCIIPVISVGWSTKEKIEQNNILNLKEIVASTAEHRAAVISLFLEEKMYLLNMLVSLYQEDYLCKQDNLDQLFLAISTKGDIVDLQVIDATGNQQAYVGPYRKQVEGKSYDQAPWFQETLIRGVHISDLFRGYRDVPHFVVAVTDPLKQYVLRATINSSLFNSLLLSAQPGPNGDACLVNRTGELQTPSLQNVTHISSFEKELITYDNPKSFHITSDYVYVTRWIENHDWLLLVKANIKDSLGQYYSIRNHVIIVVCIVSLLAMAGAVIASYWMTRHLEVTDKKNTANNMQFAQMEKMATVGRLAAGIAHEINNPLQMITNQAGWIGELLEEENPEKMKGYGEYVDAVSSIKNHVRRAGTITHRLLGFSRKMDDQNKKESIPDLLEETISLVEKEAEYNNIKIIRTFNKSLPFVITDGPQLQQVFLNILNNSIDAIGQDGEIYIEIHQTEVSMHIAFGDTGPGIKSCDLAHIFDPFFTTKGVGKGTGLGLYISYDIIKKLGGSLEAANRKNGGAEFTISIPCTGTQNGF